MKTTMTATKSKTGASKLQSRNQLARTAKDDFQTSQPTAPCKPVQSTGTDTAPEEAPAWRGVFFDGPQPDRNREGDEIPVWSVFVGDDEGVPMSRIYRVYSFTKAEALAQAMAKDRQLELITDAMPADVTRTAEPVAA
jgi:hypothetical protein